mmetsp:Transcript_61853/g.143959  ORF Transcript_61853/g.143959 Transcript_61853/m.143959 type:complete len:113 (-) Transcript_61853:75-413(-)
MNGLMEQGSGGWRIGLLSPDTQVKLKQASEEYFRRAGGRKQAVGAMLVGGFTSAAVFQRVPYVPATLAGAAAGGWAVQLPQGNRLGDAARQVGGGAAAAWDAVSDAGNWGYS